MNDQLNIRSDIKTGKTLMVSNFSCHKLLPNFKIKPLIQWSDLLTSFPNCLYIIILYMHTSIQLSEQKIWFCMPTDGHVQKGFFLSSLSGTGRKLSKVCLFGTGQKFPIIMCLYFDSYVGQELLFHLLTQFLEPFCIKKKIKKLTTF